MAAVLAALGIADRIAVKFLPRLQAVFARLATNAKLTTKERALANSVATDIGTVLAVLNDINTF